MPERWRKPYNWGAVPLASFAEKFGTPESALYPYCYMHITPAVVFGNERVTFLDNDANAIELLRREGLKAVHADVREFKPKGQKYDMLILLQPELGARHVIAHLKKGGFVLANTGDYTAEELLFERGSFELLGVIDRKTGEFARATATAINVLEASWRHYQEWAARLSSIGGDMEVEKSYLPSVEVAKAWNMRDMFVLREDG